MIELIKKLGISRLAAMGVVALMLIGFLAFIIIRSTAPQFAPLYTGLELNDASAIIAELEATGVPYQLRGDGETILAPRDQLTSLRMTLAQSGLPNLGQIGYEIFDQSSPLGSTSFVQNINHIRALEGELARSIMSIARVRNARVHLVLPTKELFSRQSKQPTASIVLSLKGHLTAGEVRAIQHLVAFAIEDLSPTAVSIIDNQGTLLASGSAEDASMLSAQGMGEQVSALEMRLRHRIEDMLSNVVGAGRARVEVSAELDLNRTTRTHETFDPDTQVVRSSQSRETSDQSSAGQNGKVSVANQLPGAQESQGAGAGLNTSKTLEETTNYEISKRTETNITEAGSLKRLSVAVVVDGTYNVDAAGAASYNPRTATEIEAISALVRSAMGFDIARGDQLEVINLQFAETPNINLGADPAGIFALESLDIMQVVELGIIFLIAIALIFFIMRPLLRKALKSDETVISLTPEQEITPTTANTSPQKTLAPEQREWMNEAWNLGQTQQKTIQMVGELIEDNPKQASTIVRDWLTQAA